MRTIAVCTIAVVRRSPVRREKACRLGELFFQTRLGNRKLGAKAEGQEERRASSHKEVSSAAGVPKTEHRRNLTETLVLHLSVLHRSNHF